MISRPSAVVPSSMSPDGAESSSSIFSVVSSSGARSSGSERAVGVLALAALQVRAVAPDAHDDAVVADRDRVDPARVDLFQPRLDEPLEAALRGDAFLVLDGVRVLGAEVEPAQPVDARALAVGDVVEVVLDRRGEVVVDEPGEVGLEQADDRERRPGRDERRALLPDVAAVLDGLHDRRVGGRAADAELLHRLDQRRLGVARRRRGGVPVGLEAARVEGVAALELRQPLLGVVLLAAESVSST